TGALMNQNRQPSFIDRRLVWLEDFKTTVEPIARRISWAQDGVKDYGLLLIRNMFVLNAGALVAAPAYATAIREKTQLLGILAIPIAVYIVGLICAALCAISSYYN